MDVVSIVSGLRTSTSGCAAAALVDLDTNMVLTTNSDVPIHQEHWDDMTKTARCLLLSVWSQDIANALGGVPYLQCAVLRLPKETQLFVRSQAEPPLGFLFICDAHAPIDDLACAAATELEIIANAD